MPALLACFAAVLLSFAPPELEPTLEASAPSFAFERFADDPIGVRQFVLDNGLTVLLSENHERPEVFGAVVVRTGGKNDPADNTGMAHYLEHMLFKGTQSLGTSDWAAEQPLQQQIIDLYERHKRATSDEQRAKIQAQIGETVEQTYAYVIPNELDRMLEEIGSTDVNAFTNEDQTVYHNRFPASQIDAWLQVYAHRFVDPVFRLFPTELEAVYEEKNISLDRFEAELYDQFVARAFPGHPYGTQSVIGEVEHLKNPSLVAMQDYFETYYVANNMALVLSGDFDADAIMPIIAERFGEWRRGPDPQPRGGTVEDFDGRELVKLRLTPVRAGAFGFRTPTMREPDFAALAVMRELLSNEQGSGYLDLLVDDGKLLFVLPFPLDFAEHNFDIVFFVPRILGQTFKGAEKLVLEQYGRIARGEFDEQRMLALRDGLRRAEDRQWEDNEERALALADSFTHHDGWQGYLDYRERLAAVTREDVMRVAATYFADDHLSMRSRVGFPKQPRLDKPHYPAVTPKSGVHSSFYDQVMSAPSSTPQLKYVDFVNDVTTTPIADGVTLRSNSNPFNDTYSLELRFGVGTVDIRELWVAPAYIERLGTPAHTPAELREQLSLLGTTLTFAATNDRTVVRLEGPEQHLAAALALVDGLLREPVADRKRLAALRRERAAVAKIERRDPAHIAGVLNHYAHHGEQSAFLRDYGRKGMRKLESEQLLDAWQRAQDYELELRYVGTREAAEVAELIRSSLTLERPRPRERAVAHHVPRRVLPERDTVYFLPRRRAIQTQLLFSVDGEPTPREQRAAAAAYGEYMGGGMGGLVFQEIREFRALAYSAWAYFNRDENPAQAGYLIAGVGCQADKTGEAIEVMMGLIREQPAKPERMDALRSTLTRSLESTSPGFRELQAMIERWQHVGYDADPRAWLLADYAKLSFDDIIAFHEAQIAGRPVTLVVVGDPRRIDVDALARWGELVKVDERDIFAR